MATQILATGTTAADSADVVIAAGTPATIALKGLTDKTAIVRILLKDDANAYNDVGGLSSSNKAIVISGPGTYRFSRRAGGACGVFRG